MGKAIKKIKTPYFKQKTEYTCGPAALKMVFAYFGQYVRQSELTKTLNVSKDRGTENKELIKATTNHGFYCYVNDDSTIFEIKHFLSMDLPVIVNFIEPSENVGHYAVIVGYKGKKLILNDPWNGENFILNESDFLNRWHDESNKHRRWIMVITNTDLHLGKQFLPKNKN